MSSGVEIVSNFDFLKDVVQTPFTKLTAQRRQHEDKRKQQQGHGHELTHNNGRILEDNITYTLTTLS